MEKRYNSMVAVVRANDVITRTTCRVCGSTQLDLLIDYGYVPLAGGFLAQTAEDRNFVYPLRLVRCAECTLMQVLDTVLPDLIFHNYSYASSTTKTLINHFQQMAINLVKRWDGVGKTMVEFGCNDGVLLRPLREAGAQVIGVDPSDVARRASEEQDWPLFNTYFNLSIAERIRDVYGLARLVTANNTFAHMDDLHTVMDGVITLLEPEGVFVFEVHYQGDLVRLTQYDTVYHEHSCYYSVKSLTRLMEMHDLRIIDVEPINIHSGSIRVTAARRHSKHVASAVVDKMLLDEEGWEIERFVQRVEERRITLQQLVTDLHQGGKRIVAYGAAGRSTILLNFCNLGPSLIEYVVDMSPLRHGKMVPGVWIPIVKPDVFKADFPHYAIMTAWNYEREIIGKEGEFIRSGGRFIIPLPNIRLAEIL